MNYTDKKRFPHGVISALVTPFANMQVDYPSFKALINGQIKAGVDGMVILGTTGESPAVTPTEREKILDFAVNCIDGRAFVIAGCGGADTTGAVNSALSAQKIGVNGILTVTPYYNKPPQEGLVRHYLSVAEAVDIPLMMYNVPSRTGVNISCKTAELLFTHENISALKEASADINDITEKLTSLSGCDIYCGNDNLILPFLSLGAKGFVSVISNALPSAVQKIYDKFTLGDIDGAKAEFEKIYPLINALGKETNPIGIKTLLAHMGVCSDELRLPLVRCKSETHDKIIKAYEDILPSD